jgi:hypothetical protein
VVWRFGVVLGAFLARVAQRQQEDEHRDEGQAAVPPILMNRGDGDRVALWGTVYLLKRPSAYLQVTWR